MAMEEPSKSNGQAGMRRFLANCNDTSMRTKYTLTTGSLTSQLVHLVVCEAVKVHNRITHDRVGGWASRADTRDRDGKVIGRTC